MPTKEEIFAAAEDAGESGNSDLLRSYAAQGADFNQVIDGEFLLTKIVDDYEFVQSPFRYKLIQLLLELGADPNLLSKERISPLLSPSYNHDTEMVRILLEGGADPNKIGYDCFFMETFLDDVEFDYRYEQDLSELPERPTPEERKDFDRWLNFLDRIALKHELRRPDFLFLLRAAGARTTEELRKRNKKRCTFFHLIGLEKCWLTMTVSGPDIEETIVVLNNQDAPIAALFDMASLLQYQYYMGDCPLQGEYQHIPSLRFGDGLKQYELSFENFQYDEARFRLTKKFNNETRTFSGIVNVSEFINDLLCDGATVLNRRGFPAYHDKQFPVQQYLRLYYDCIIFKGAESQYKNRELTELAKLCAKIGKSKLGELPVLRIMVDWGTFLSIDVPNALYLEERSYSSLSVDICETFPEECGVSQSLQQRFEEWAAKFHTIDDTPDFPWEQWHQQGIRLTRELYSEIGDKYQITYCYPIEDRRYPDNIRPIITIAF